MSRSPKETLDSKLNNAFRKELQTYVKHNLDEINHYIAGCDSPFTYLQIADVQEKLREIAEILGIGQGK
jgi:predicted butyrate kinase (DUF1464 family)